MKTSLLKLMKVCVLLIQGIFSILSCLLMKHSKKLIEWKRMLWQRTWSSSVLADTGTVQLSPHSSDSTDWQGHVTARAGITGGSSSAAWTDHELQFLPGVWLPGSGQTVWQTNRRQWQSTADLSNAPSRCVCVYAYSPFLSELLNADRNMTGPPQWDLNSGLEAVKRLLPSLCALGSYDQSWESSIMSLLMKWNMKKHRFN